MGDMLDNIATLITAGASVLVPTMGFFIVLLRKQESILSELHALREIMDIEQRHIKSNIMALEARVVKLEEFKELFYRGELLNAMEKI